MDKNLKNIIERNEDLKERIEKENWSVSYNKKSDMTTMGVVFPDNSLYYPVGDTGVLLRIDKNNKIHGFAIENTKFFMMRNPEIYFALSFMVYSLRTRLLYMIVKHTMRGIDNIKKILTISDYVAGKAVYC